MKEPLSLAVAAATTSLARKLDRTPTTVEVAAHLGVDARELVTALGAAQAAFLASLNGHDLASATAGAGQASHLDPGSVQVENGSYLSTLTVQSLPGERRAAPIASEREERRDRAAGLSRMDVARLVRATIARLRVDLRAPNQLTEPGGDVLSRGEDITTRHATPASRRSLW